MRKQGIYYRLCQLQYQMEEQKQGGLLGEAKV